jgi:hypothetical protein
LQVFPSLSFYPIASAPLFSYSQASTFAWPPKAFVFPYQLTFSSFASLLPFA